MNNQLIVYGDPTPSDLLFMKTETISFNTSSTISSTRSDAQSAPPELDLLLDHICNESTKCMKMTNRQLPPEWNMPEIVRAVIGEDGIEMPSLLTADFSDIMLHKDKSRLCEEILIFIYLINYMY
jgi:hypothetical protein